MNNANRVTLAVYDLYTSIIDAPRSATSTIRSALRARPPGYNFSPKFKRGVWDGYIHLVRRNTFPTGLLDKAMYVLEEEEYVVTVDDYRIDVSYTEVTPNILHGITLRDYQVEAANALLEATRGVASMATNSGKTAVMAAMIRATEKRTLVIVHKKELLYQTSEMLHNLLHEPVVMYGAGHKGVGEITVGMIQSLSQLDDRELEFLFKMHSSGMLFADECHHVSARTMYDTMMSIPCTFRYGMSGTPLKYEVLADMQLMAATGPVVYELSNADLISSGVSAMPLVKFAGVTVPQCAGMSYHAAYRDAIVRNEYRNTIVEDAVRQHCNGGALILVNTIEHGKILYDMLYDVAEFVTGVDDDSKRMEVLHSLATGQLRAVIATPIFEEGVDVPAVSLIVLAAGGKSRIRLLQRVGRGLRAKGSKDAGYVTILDFTDNTNKYLRSHASQRRSVYEREGFEISEQ